MHIYIHIYMHVCMYIYMYDKNGPYLVPMFFLRLRQGGAGYGPRAEDFHGNRLACGGLDREASAFCCLRWSVAVDD